ncbi:MAG: hypothetical protein PHZ25_00895 [Candidatus Pacebacteria bacterium]|nr:hypothetical protein [Candidatus Paceibacterota bacterium]
MEEQIKKESLSFNPEDMEKIKTETERLRLSPENKNVPEKEIIKSSLKSVFPPEEETFSPKEEIAGAPDYLKNPSLEIKNKLARLEEISRKKGINEAIKEAGRENPFLLDAFHDYLAEKIMEERIVK